MRRILVNIRGTNGTGKSTIPMSMLDDPKMCVETLVDSDHKTIAKFTVFPTYGWIALGTYFNKTGGLDTLSCNESIRVALHAAICMYPLYDVLMEGFLCSGLFTSYEKLFNEVQDAYGIDVLIISLVPPVEEAIKRVYKRNGGKPYNEKNTISKGKAVLSSHKKFKEAGFKTVRVDTSNVRKSRMLPCFLRTVEKHRRK